MKKQRFSIPLYDVEVTLVQVESPDDIEGVVACCNEAWLPQEDIEAVSEYITNDNHDGGDTFRNFDKGQMLVIFYRMTNGRTKRNIYGHEKRHVEDRVLQWCGVNDIEAAAYLAGFLTEQFADFYYK